MSPPPVGVKIEGRAKREKKNTHALVERVNCCDDDDVDRAGAIEDARVFTTPSEADDE